MARFEYNIRRLARLATCLALVGMSSSAAAQINERDRLERCDNNRARMLEIQAAWPAGPGGWSDDQIARARLVANNFRSQAARVSLIDVQSSMEAQMRGSGNVTEAYRILGEMAQTARDFDIICFPSSLRCANVYADELRRKLDDAQRGAPQRAALLRQFNGYRSNYIALNCVQGANAAASASDLGFAMMTGSFDSSFGLLTLSTGGGSYDYQGGQVRVTGISGNVMEGIWTQTRSAERCSDGQYRGRFRFEFSATGFSGSYTYCDGTTGGAWNGTRR